MVPLHKPITASYGLVLAALGHLEGWPLARGGSKSIAAALSGCLEELGGDIHTGCWVRSTEDLPPASASLFDVSARQLQSILGERLPESYRRKLGRFRPGPGVFKMDWALSGPIPWRAPACSEAATVHLCGSFEDLAASERSSWSGEIPVRPFVILGQPSLFDPARAPEGKHVVWAYCHVPNGCDADLSARIENQIERFAPGFRELVLARHALPPAELERRNPNLLGGDIGGGANDLLQFFRRPVFSLSPYNTPLKGVYLCSASTPPGGGVHGLCGYHAARAVIRDAQRPRSAAD
jgi:phytoene dehydrogenase-like protein